MFFEQRMRPSAKAASFDFHAKSHTALRHAVTITHASRCLPTIKNHPIISPKKSNEHNAEAISFWNRIPKPSIPPQQWGKCGTAPSFGFPIKIHDHDGSDYQLGDQGDEKGQADQQTDVEGTQKIGENQHQKSTGKNQ
jgi:hypothetical protein